MDAVLGLSMTPTTVGLVLVEGQDADGATMDHDEFAVHDRGLVSAVNTSERAAAAVLRTEAMAAARGHRLHSIGVTWSEDADTEASLLLESLSESGLDNVVPVRLPEATEALARGIGSVIGYEITAVCVIEPDAVIVMVVNAHDDAVQTAVSHSITTDEDLARWLSAVFAQTDWQPEALVLVGSGSDLDAITPRLEEVLSVPVFVPAEAQLALARGAAIASAQDPDYRHHGVGEESARGHGAERRLWPGSHVGAATAVLIAGVVTFVVSGSLAIGLRLTSGEGVAPVEQRPAADISPDQPAAVKSDQAAAVESVPSAPAAPPPIVEAAPPPLPPPAAEVAAPPPQLAFEPAPAAEPLVSEPLAPEPIAPPAVAVPEAPLAPVPAGAPLVPPPGAVSDAPGLVPAPVTPVPEKKPGILQRIKDKLSGIGKPDEPATADPALAPPADPALAPPPDPALAPPPPPPPDPALVPPPA
jgi:hypothetical protein